MKLSLECLRKQMDPVPSGRLLIGVSGGADSIALLMMLQGDGKYRMAEAVHVNHGIRGAAADEDEAFVRDVCGKLRIPLHVYHPDLKGHSDENTARKARFQCFRACMLETGAEWLVLAHHADDLAETFMMRLLRGAGTEGLGCMSPAGEAYGIPILRPMLKMRREEIRAALTAAGVSWREDESNHDTAYLRNDVRHRLLPLMEEMNPGAAGRVAAAARKIAADNETLNLETRSMLDRCAGKRWIDIRPVLPLTPGQHSRLLRQWWRDNATLTDEHELSTVQTEQLVALSVAVRGKINLPGNLYAVKGKQALHLTGFREKPIPEQAVSGTAVVFGDWMLQIGQSEGNPGNGKTEQEVPSGFTEGCVIRTRRPGDRITPFGMTGSRKLQDYLTDRGIDEPWRDRIPLLCRGNEVLLAAGVGAGNIPRWRKEESHVRIRWQGDMPWNR